MVRLNGDHREMSISHEDSLSLAARTLGLIICVFDNDIHAPNSEILLLYSPDCFDLLYPQPTQDASKMGITKICKLTAPPYASNHIIYKPSKTVPNARSPTELLSIPVNQSKQSHIHSQKEELTAPSQPSNPPPYNASIPSKKHQPLSTKQPLLLPSLITQHLKSG